MSNLYVRDGAGNPKEISSIFVRDALGNPQKICKIFVRDANGNPQLVYNCSAVVVPCPECGSGQYPLYYLNDLLVKYRPRFGVNGQTNDGNVATAIPNYDITKDYWSKVSAYSQIRDNETELLITDNDPYLSKVEFILPDGCEFCTNVDAPSTADWLNFSKYWESLQDAYNTVGNYPLIPGHIIADWNSFSVRDTIYIMSKLLQRKFTSLCTHPNTRAGLPANPGNPYCPEVGVDVSATKYPFFNRPIFFRFSGNDPETAYCGQELCSAGLWGQYSWYSINGCHSGWSRMGGFFRPDEPVSSNCCDGSDPNCEGTSSSGTSLDEYRCKCCEPNSQEPECAPGTVWGPPPCGEIIDGWCDCQNFWGSEYIPPEENPFTFLVSRKDHATSRTIPVLTSSASTPQDCCQSTCYGPVAYPSSGASQACRHVTQIPPINSIVDDAQSQQTTMPYASNLSFFRDFAISVLMDSTGLGGSAASVRVVLPYYVTLDPSLKARKIELKQNQYEAFINDGNGPTPATSSSFYNAHLSIWNAIKGILGIRPGTEWFNVPLEERIWLSSNHFIYEEMAHETVDVFGNRYFEEESLPYGRPFSEADLRVGVGEAGLNWSINGYPTEKHTHYVVFELMYTSSNKCFNNIFKEEALQNLQNQKFFVKGIKFYPLDRICRNRNNKYHKHPLFQTHIVPEIVQNYGRRFEYLGFVDRYLGNNSWGESNPNLDGDLNTFRIPNYWQFNYQGTPIKYDLVYPPAAAYGNTYQGFLVKHYRQRI